MNEDLKQSFQQIVSDFGPDVINNKNLANIVADYFSFDRNPAVRNILKAIVSDGYVTKISQLKTSKGDPSIDLERYAGEIEQSWGYRKEQVIYVLSCIASSVGIVCKTNSSTNQNPQSILPSPSTPIVNTPINQNQSNQQNQQNIRKPFIQNGKVKYLLWSLLVVIALIVSFIFIKSSAEKDIKPSAEEDRLALDHAKECYDNGDYNTAFEIWEKYAKLDSVRGMNGLGLCYSQGKGILQDYKEAMRWFRKAAEQGFAKAQTNLGIMYIKGEDVPIDYKEALKWFRKAAEQGYAGGQYNLGLMYDLGEGVPVNYDEARKWYTKAVEQGYAPAQLNLGYMYLKGNGVPIDYKEARKWYTKAAEQGNAGAQYNLGLMYEEGKGVPVDYEEARKWYNKAAGQGNESAKEALKTMK